jgi:hypothetical protein
MRSAASLRLVLRLPAALSRAFRKVSFAWSTTWSFTSRIWARAPPVLDSSLVSALDGAAGDGVVVVLGIVIAVAPVPRPA